MVRDDLHLAGAPEVDDQMVAGIFLQLLWIINLCFVKIISTDEHCDFRSQNNQQIYKQTFNLTH